MINLGNLMIMGDSYSTFEGLIPDGYDTYYVNGGNGNTDVDKAEQTWWMRLVADTESGLVRNSSWSGTAVCNTGWGGRDNSDPSFVQRFDALAADGFFDKNKIDTFIIFGGTNDSWADSPLDEPKFENWTDEDLYCTLPAIGYLVSRAAETMPDARVVCIINTELKPEIGDCFEKACERFGAEYIRLCDIDKMNGHPTIKGMAQIEQQVIDFFEKNI